MWRIDGIHKHPLHLHSISYQLGGVEDPTGFFRNGDWQDVVKLPHDPPIEIDAFYFSAVSIGSKSVVHCHFLSHEDTGCMGFFELSGPQHAKTGLSGRSMSCTGFTTDGRDFDVSKCITSTTRLGWTYPQNLFVILINGLIFVFVFFFVSYRRHRKANGQENLAVTPIESVSTAMLIEMGNVLRPRGFFGGRSGYCSVPPHDNEDVANSDICIQNLS